MKTLTYLFLFLSLSASGQLLYDFEDASSEVWQSIPPGRWEISSENPIEGEFSLHHSFDNPEAGTDYISRDLSYADLEDTLRFSFRLRHGYNPSSGNNWQFFLMSNANSDIDKKMPENSALLFGINYYCSDDLLKLWALKDGIVSEVFSTELNYQDIAGIQKAPLFLLQRDPDGTWTGYFSLNAVKDSLQEVGSGIENALLHGKYAGFRYAYSSAQDRKLWIDLFGLEGDFYRDTHPPVVESLNLPGLNTIQLLFTENVVLDEQTDISCFSNNLDSMVVHGNLLDLFFEKEFPNRKEIALHLRNIKDTEGNVLRDTIINFEQQLAEFGELLINEIMPDPYPRVYLPDCEYVELFNPGERDFDLSGWFLTVNDKSYSIDHQMLEAGAYLILCSGESDCQFSNSSICSLFSSATCLPNTGATIRLLDQHRRLIHFVQYKSLSFYEELKAEGGWALECLDPGNPCGTDENWSLSSAWQGGTPGLKNSVEDRVPDETAPALQFIGLTAKDRIKLSFTEPVFFEKEGDGLVTLDEQSLEADYEHLYTVSPEMEYQLEEDLDPAHLYHMALSGMKDCAGNIMEIASRDLALTVQPEECSMLLNEIMYDPFAGGNEYIELYNSGTDFLDLKDLKMKISAGFSEPASSFFLSEDSHLVAPESYLLICKNSSRLREEWFLSPDIDIVEPEMLKILPDGGGCIALLDRAERVIDYVCYADSCHSDLLSFTSGVALERMSPSCRISGVWTSAATTVNYGSPGELNSQTINTQDEESSLSLSPEVFSPDLDAYKDILNISIPNLDGKSLVDIYITDLNGILVREIVSRGFSGSESHFIWDGKGDDGYLVFPGMYIVHANIVAEDFKRHFRKVCAVIYKE